ERVPKVDHTLLSIAQAAGAEARDGLVVLRAREGDDVRFEEGTPGDREPIHDVVLRARELPDAISDELLERRRQGLATVGRRALVSVQLVPAVLTLDDLERPALEEGVDHFEEEERVACDARQELRANRGDAVAHAQPRLDEAHLLLRGESAQLDADEPL